ncbi:hypothetical protein EN871_27770 [bacterium M00.F.Ca.ET.228.01.1.1]|nr:hypothetical protein EN871_27770 [bacterium M00.F.Ca.ET.228.01.1.1]TGR96694.1 hypothetical protein EN834_27220 [bacterium M00.F.Ca.ET.191.01.1.1]TGT97961.1 hypothetical protein EN798_27225 [bacterium M00.F.Ca.ET.155.01.1.1]
MSLTVHQYTMADVRTTGVFGERGLGTHTLKFSTTFDIANQHPDHPAGMFIDSLRANVWLQSANRRRLLLGPAEFEQPLIIRRLNHAMSQPSLLRLMLSDRQLLALEELRGGGGLVFEVEIIGLAHAPNDTYPVADSVRVEVNLSNWVKVLESLGVADSFVVGVEAPLDAPPQMAHAIEYLKKARYALAAGEYEQTVSFSRLSLDSLKKASPMLEQLSESVRGGKSQDFSKSQRAAALYNVVRNYTNLGHHLDAAGQPVLFSRRDAVMVLTTTASLAGMVAELESKPTDNEK